MPGIDSEDQLEKYLVKIHSQVYQIIQVLVAPYPDIAFKLYLTATLQSHSIKISYEKFLETTLGYLNGAVAIYKEEDLEPKIKSNLFIQLIATVLQLKGLQTEPLTQLVEKIRDLSKNLPKRVEQCNAMLACSHLFYTLLDNKEQANACILKAKRYADFAMTNPEHLDLFVIILNKFIYYADTLGDNMFISKELFEDVIETIRNHIQTIKTEGLNQSFLPEIERYFESTLENIKKKKEEGQIKYYIDI